MANTVIQLKHSTLTGNVPSSLANGEISINSRDGKFFYSTPAGVVVTHYPYPGPAGLNQELQFNDSGVLGTNSGLTFSKTTGVFTAPIVASSNNGQGTNFKVGDDVWLGDINLSDTLSIRGQQNVNNAYISFGASNANTLGRAGTGPLTYTGAFTATGIISGSEISATQSSGDEGGQINLALAATNTSLSGTVAIDIYQNRLRIFETSGSNRGVFIDLANGASSSVGTNLLSSSTSTDTFARNQANAAFLQANTPSNVANSAASYANSAFGRANTAAVAANTPSSTANSAFVRANNSLDANNGGTVTGTITATSFITTGSFGNITGANTIYANNFVANTGFIQFADGSKQYTANAGSGGGGSSNSFATISNTATALVANTSNTRLTIVGESGIVVAMNSSINQITIAAQPGAQGLTVDYGFVAEPVYYALDYGTLS